MGNNLGSLIAAQDALFYAAGTNAEAKAEGRMMDAAISAGMAWDHGDLAGWVKAEIRRLSDEQDGDDPIHQDDAAMYGRDPETGLWEYS